MHISTWSSSYFAEIYTSWKTYSLVKYEFSLAKVLEPTEEGCLRTEKFWLNRLTFAGRPISTARSDSFCDWRRFVGSNGHSVPRLISFDAAYFAIANLGGKPNLYRGNILRPILWIFRQYRTVKIVRARVKALPSLNFGIVNPSNLRII